jgi:hypothetical protein
MVAGQKERKDNSHLYQAVDIEGLASDLLDTRMAHNIIGDLKRHGGFQMHKPLLVPSGYGAPGINPSMIDKAKMKAVPQSALKKVGHGVRSSVDLSTPSSASGLPPDGLSNLSKRL